MTASKKDEPILEVKHLSKQYSIGTDRTYKTFSDSFISAVRNPLKALKNSHKLNNTFWALKDVNFKIERGEVVGVIGRNGAGKSTLLKILSRITYPTEGEIRIRGRVGSLLEVGTGFHPELSGRENIYFNGSILGMKRKEIDDKFDEIVKFSGVEKFLDTPVKRYSSGMQIRLAFSVAANLDPEILVVDEVLAVGDAAFQKKCLGKMREVSKDGKTVLFVSHNMAAVLALCSKAMVLNYGKIELPLSETSKAVETYLSEIQSIESINLADRKDRQGEGKIRMTKFGLFDRNGNEIYTPISGQHVEFRIYYECVNNPTPTNISAAIGFSSAMGQFIAMLWNEMANGTFDEIPQKGYLSCIVESLPIAPMGFFINLTLMQNGVIQDWIKEAGKLTVEGGDFYGTGRVTAASHGGFLMHQIWSVNNNKL